MQWFDQCYIVLFDEVLFTIYWHSFRAVISKWRFFHVILKSNVTVISGKSLGHFWSKVFFLWNSSISVVCHAKRFKCRQLTKWIQYSSFSKISSADSKLNRLEWKVHLVCGMKKTKNERFYLITCILGPCLYFWKFAVDEKYETHFFIPAHWNLSLLCFFFVWMTRYNLMLFCAILKINGGPKTYLHLYYMRVFLILRLHWLLNGPWICLNDPNYNLTYRLDNSTSYIYKIHKTKDMIQYSIDKHECTVHTSNKFTVLYSTSIQICV